jgi:hypothetical protein
VATLEKDMATAVKFVNFVSEEKDDKKLLETINTDVKNSSIFNLDEFFKTLAKLYKFSFFSPPNF